MTYKLSGNSIYNFIVGVYIPQDPANSDYQQFIKDVAEQGIEIVEGPDIHEPSYVELRQQAYPSLQEQQDMQYWDQLNGTTIWQDTITAIKEQYSKTITGGTTIGPVPDWVQEVADNWIFNKQLREYAAAVERLSQYILSEGRPELTEEIVIGQEPVLDENNMPTFDEECNQIFQDITRTVVVQTAIDPLPEFVEVSNYDMETGETITEEIRNPEIVRDEEERAAAQLVVDSTPEEVVDTYNQALQ